MGSIFRGKWHFGASGALSEENEVSGESEEWEECIGGRDTRIIRGEVWADTKRQKGEREHLLKSGL